MLYRTTTKLERLGRKVSNTLEVKINNPYTIIDTKLETKTPIEVYIISILIGTLVLILISFAMYKFGFFKRTEMEQLKQKIRESRMVKDDEVSILPTSEL